MTFDVLKSLHIIFVVSWFAGLFYMVRLFIYHTEAQLKEEREKQILSNQFQIMEKKLWWVITTPAMILTVVFGTWMIIEDSDYYLSQGSFKFTSTQLRLWNELATFFFSVNRFCCSDEK